MTKEVKENSRKVLKNFLALFWSSPKRPPKEVQFDFEDLVHRGFVVSLANLMAEVWGLPRHNDAQKFREVGGRKIVEFVQRNIFF
jgi:ubiquitin-activating enzyme E1